ncbi:hypothetical protein [Kitasatospora sp. NPDC090091]|uniref:hypothetical protein n=1 Tax=Kitasatospora sp. NPDC090091 TaxID=3364081 RepID=UPI00381A2658
MTAPSPQLQNALDALDTAFAPLFGQPFTGGGCTYCYTETDLEALAGPPHRVPGDLIPAVAAESTDHWDDFAALYRRMTPRIIRLLTTGQLHVDHGLVASRLLAADWRNWTVPEQEALEGVWQAWWRSALHEHPGTDHVTGVLEAISVSTGSLAPWLALWAETRTETADRHLSDALDDWLFEGRLTDLRFGFYNELDAGPELVTWLLSLDEGRIGAAQLLAVERIAYGY